MTSRALTMSAIIVSMAGEVGVEGSGAARGDWRVERDTDGYVVKVGRCRNGSLLF